MYSSIEGKPNAKAPPTNFDNALAIAYTQSCDFHPLTNLQINAYGKGRYIRWLRLHGKGSSTPQVFKQLTCYTLGTSC